MMDKCVRFLEGENQGSANAERGVGGELQGKTKPHSLNPHGSKFRVEVDFESA